jgi:erythronate-4-phosphate dehydrogenase
MIDENIPLAQEAFSEFGKTELQPGRAITNTMLRDIDVLIVRSVTKVNAVLLERTPVKFVGTATIGLDHIDVDYLRDKNIFFANAAGSNANSVAEYIVAAILHHVCEKRLRLSDLTIGVVGVGNVGRRVVRYAEALGMRVLQNDPPRQRAEKSTIFLPLNDLMKADIISLHTPLTMTGADATFHLFDRRRLAQMKTGSLLINTARGGVVETNALKDAVSTEQLNAILDVWENEPEIDGDLLQQVEIGTPHIAGYSYDGKINGTMQIYNAFCEFLDHRSEWRLDKSTLPQPAKPRIEIEHRAATLEEALRHIVMAAYDICNDSAKLKTTITFSKQQRGRHFDDLRKNYPVRREFSSYKISASNLDEKLITMLRAIGFAIDA